MKINIIFPLFIILITSFASCKSKSEIWYEMKKNQTLTLDDYTKEFGEPINIIKKDGRTTYEFFGGIDPKECINKTEFHGKISFDNPRKYEGGCYTNIQYLKDSKENIEGWITNWVFRTNDLTGKEIGRYEFHKDKTYNFSTSILGGFASSGTYVIKLGYKVGEANVVLYPPEEQVKSGNVPSEIYLTVFEEGNKIQNDNTVYLPIK